MNTKTTNAGDNKQPQTTSQESRRDDDQFSNDWWREFAETWK